ncbi:MAG: hypothetical protein VX438_03925, partial [Planctomycetota bacterium]|nr:hypothetical protein [Planctomycetota bacterium]
MPFRSLPLDPVLKFLFLVCAIVPLHSGFEKLAAQTQQPSIRGISNSLGFREHRAGLWSYLNPEIQNPTGSEAQLEVVLFFAGAQNQKFAKRVTVPPRSILRTSVPVLIPETASRGIDVQVHLYDVSGNKPVLLLKELKQFQKGKRFQEQKRSYDTAISIRDSSFGESGSKYRATAMFQPALRARQKDQDDAAELVSAARIYFNHNGRIGTSTTMYLPTSARAFESVDQIVLHNDHLLNDSGGLESVRRWVARGGNLWIMLDLVSEETVQRILGDSIPFQMIDRTSLNTIQILEADPNSQAAIPKPRNFEDPIEFVRVILNKGNLLQTHDGWPAAFSMKFNQGTVFFTTIGSRAWMRDRNPRLDPPIKNRLGVTQFTVTDPMEQLGYKM